MKRTLSLLIPIPTSALVMLMASSTLAIDPTPVDSMAVVEGALVKVAADSIDATLGAVADSTRALGDAYGRLASEAPDSPRSSQDRWLARRTTKEQTTGLRSWPPDLTSPPSFQAPYPAFYSYRGATLSETVLHQLDLFEKLAPTLRSAFESFPFSWVYLTTADEAMVIYPYLPIDEAVNNGTPTESVFYQAADFANRRVGWSPPYLDLVGAGLMVTASHPIYRGDTLLGVMSRDITLKQLTSSLLSRLIEGGSNALIVDRNGLAIDATDPDLAHEIEIENSGSRAAVLHYRSPSGMKSIASQDAVPSKTASINRLVERVLSEAMSPGPVRFHQGPWRVLASRIKHTGWLLIWVRPVASPPPSPQANP